MRVHLKLLSFQRLPDKSSIFSGCPQILCKKHCVLPVFFAVTMHLLVKIDNSLSNVMLASVQNYFSRVARQGRLTHEMT